MPARRPSVLDNEPDERKGHSMNLMAIIGWVGLGGIASWLIFFGPMTVNAIRMARKSTALARKSSALSLEGSAAFKESTEQLKRATAIEGQAFAVQERMDEQMDDLQELLIELRAKIDFARERMPSLRDEWLALSERDRIAHKLKAAKALFAEKYPN